MDINSKTIKEASYLMAEIYDATHKYSEAYKKMKELMPTLDETIIFTMWQSIDAYVDITVEV